MYKRQGPHGTLTPRVLDILRDNNVKGTFFMQGCNAVSYTPLDVYQRQGLMFTYNLLHTSYYSSKERKVNLLLRLSLIHI